MHTNNSDKTVFRSKITLSILQLIVLHDKYIKSKQCKINYLSMRYFEEMIVKKRFGVLVSPLLPAQAPFAPLLVCVTPHPFS